MLVRDVNSKENKLWILLQHADSISFQICRVTLIVWTLLFCYESRQDSAILRKESLRACRRDQETMEKLSLRSPFL